MSRPAASSCWTKASMSTRLEGVYLEELMFIIDNSTEIFSD